MVTLFHQSLFRQCKAPVQNRQRLRDPRMRIHERHIQPSLSLGKKPSSFVAIEPMNCKCRFRDTNDFANPIIIGNLCCQGLDRDAKAPDPVLQASPEAKSISTQEMAPYCHFPLLARRIPETVRKR